MTRRTRFGRVFALAMAFALVAAACGDDDGGDDDATTTTEAAGEQDATTTTAAEGEDQGADRGNVDGTLKLGALMPETGDLSAIVQSLRVPFDLAVEEINAAGGVNGQPVEIAAADDGSDATKSANGFDRLAESDLVDAIVGPASSDSANAVLDKAKTSRLVTCTGSATAGSLTDAQEDDADGGFFFRTAPPDRFQGPALADFVTSEEHTAVALLVRNDPYGTGFAAAMEERFEANGVEVVESVAYDPSAASFDTDVQQVAGANPDAVVLIAFPDDGGKVLNAMITGGIGPKDVAIYTADGLQSGGFFERVDAENPSIVEGMKGTAPASAPGGVESPFIETFAETGTDPIFSSYYYDCTMLIALAAQAAGSDDPAEIREEMANVATGGETCNTFADCKALLEEGEDIDFEGASGSLDLSDLGEPESGTYDLWAFDDKGAVQVNPAEEQITITADDL